MKTPEEIKKGLECGYCEDCSYREYRGRNCTGRSRADALAYIQQLERERDELLQENEQLKHESDMAVLDLEMCCPCEVCTRSCKYDKVNAYDECADFEWRGVQEVENNACQKGFDGLS